jgi:YVTN family beta-propeller protein
MVKCLKQPGAHIRSLLFLYLFLIFWFLIFFSGCTAAEKQGAVYDVHKGQFTLFLNGPDKADRDVTFSLRTVTILTDEGLAHEVLSSPVTINSKSLTGKQVLLGEKTVTEGTYKKLEISIGEAYIFRKGRKASLSLSSESLGIDIDSTVQKGRNISVFLIWDADTSVSDEVQFIPSLTVRSERPELSSLLMYVTNEGSHNVSVINRQLGQVVATIMVGKNPRGITTGTRKNYQKVYVANSGSNSVSVIDPLTNSVESEIPIRFGWEPVDLAFTSISPEKEFIFVTNYKSNNVSVIDAISNYETEKIDVGTGPVAVAVDPPVDTLFESQTLSFEDIQTLRSYRERFYNVYVANRNSNTVSVLRMNVRSGRCEEVISLDVEWSPVDLEVDYERGKVYVANYNSEKLSFIDILKIVRGETSRAVGFISNIDTAIIGVIADPVFERIYLLKENSGEILIIRPFQEDFRRVDSLMPPVIDTISVGTLPRALILDPESRQLYIVNRGSNSISVINKTTRKQSMVIPVGNRPYDIAVIQEVS